MVCKSFDVAIFEGMLTLRSVVATVYKTCIIIESLKCMRITKYLSELCFSGSGMLESHSGFIFLIDGVVDDSMDDIAIKIKHPCINGFHAYT